MPLTLTRDDSVIFEKAPLTAVICQINFSPVLAIHSDEGVLGFNEAVRTEYPNFQKAGNVQVAVAPGQVNVAQSAPVWRGTSADNAWTVSLAAEFVALETSAYVDIDGFWKRLARVLDATARTIAPSPSKRIGLRKINQFHREPPTRPQDFRELLKPEVLGLLAATTDADQVGFEFTDFQIRDEECLLHVRHGALPEGDGFTYVLDLDYSSDQPHEIRGDESMAAIVQHAARRTTQFFQWCLTDETFNALGPRPKEATG